MKFSLAKSSDTEDIKKLWAYSFESYEPYFSWYFNTIYQTEQTLCAFEGQELLACLQMIPYHLFLRGSELPATYIVGVIASPAARGQGIGTVLMEQAFIHLNKQNIPVSLLLPACPDFYFPLGFAYCYEEHRWQVPLTWLKKLAQSPAPGKWQEAGCNEADIEALDSVYRTMTAGKNGFILRNKTNWQNYLTEFINDGGKIWLFSDGLNPQAYLLYSFKDRVFAAREMGYTSFAAQRAAFAFIMGHLNEADKLHWSAPPSDPAYLLLPFQDGISSRPFVMGRTINAAKLLSAIPYPPQIKANIGITISDKHAPWNNQSLLISISEGQAAISETKEEFACQIDSKALTSLIFGHQSAKDLAWQESIRGAQKEELEVLEACFPLCDNWINEQS